MHSIMGEAPNCIQSLCCMFRPSFTVIKVFPAAGPQRVVQKIKEGEGYFPTKSAFCWLLISIITF